MKNNNSWLKRRNCNNFNYGYITGWFGGESFWHWVSTVTQIVKWDKMTKIRSLNELSVFAEKESAPLKKMKIGGFMAAP